MLHNYFNLQRGLAAATLLSTVAMVSASLAYAEDSQHTQAAAAPRTVTVAVGAESPDMALQINQFLPGQISVNVGDTVTWRVDATEFHTVSFLAGAAAEPFEVPTPDGLGMMVNPKAAFPVGGAVFDGSAIASSGVLNKEQTYSLTFTQPGVYEYLCLVHPGMQSEVIVKNAGEPVDSLLEIEAATRARADEVLAASQLPGAALEGPRGVAATVIAGDGADNVSLMRFAPGDVQIRVGETVAFTNHDVGMMPHTVSFRIGGYSPEAITPVPQPAGPPLLVFNPDVVEARGAADAFSGTEYVNSGILFHGGPGQPFTVTFTQPGTYEYVCLFHENMGMRGTITVEP